MGGEKGQQIGSRPPLELGRAAARSRAPSHAMEPGPGLILGLGHRPSGGHDEVASVVLDALWPAPASPGIVQELAMVVVALASVVVAAMPWRSLRRR